MIGGCGFLGRHIVEKLLEKDYQVNVFDIKQSFEDARVKFYIGDLCKKEVRQGWDHKIFPGILKLSIKICLINNRRRDF